MAVPPIILALDMATRTGWACGDGSKLPQHGWIDLPAPDAGDRGQTFTAFRNFVIDRLLEQSMVCEVGQFVMVLFEQPILPKPFMKDGLIIWPTSIEVTLLLQGLAAIVEQLCDELGIACEMVDVGTVKKEFAGDGRAEKPDMVRAAESMGLTITHHDEADAVAVWTCGVRHYNPASVEWIDPLLFVGRGGLL